MKWFNRMPGSLPVNHRCATSTIERASRNVTSVYSDCPGPEGRGGLRTDQSGHEHDAVYWLGQAVANCQRGIVQWLDVTWLYHGTYLQEYVMDLQNYCYGRGY